MGVRAKGRPQNRWRDEAPDDLKKLKLRNWSQSGAEDQISKLT
jgi:hypothetical protein